MNIIDKIQNILIKIVLARYNICLNMLNFFASDNHKVLLSGDSVQKVQTFENGHICKCNYPFKELPKGHGRLIDAETFQKYCFNKNFDKRLSEAGLATINMFLEFQDTIIEADNGSENEND